MSWALLRRELGSPEGVNLQHGGDEVSVTSRINVAGE